MLNIKYANNRLVLKGRVDTNTAPQLEKFCKEMLNFKEDIRIDFSNVEYISSAGLRVILSMQKRYKTNGGNMFLINISDANREIFNVTGFSDIISIA